MSVFQVFLHVPAGSSSPCCLLSSVQVGGVTMLDGIKKLVDDPSTAVICLVSKVCLLFAGPDRA